MRRKGLSFRGGTRHPTMITSFKRKFSLGLSKGKKHVKQRLLNHPGRQEISCSNKKLLGNFFSKFKVSP